MSKVLALPNGTAVDVEINKAPPITVAVTPGAGDTVSVWFDIGSGHWYPWDAGGVTVATIRVIRGPIRQVRFQRTSGSGVASVGEVL